MDVTTTICSFCGRDLSKEKVRRKYILCKHCKILVPIGAHSFKNKFKGGLNMAEKDKKEKVEKPKKEEGKSITDERIENAQACIDLLKSKGLSSIDMRKVFSRGYNMCKG